MQDRRDYKRRDCGGSYEKPAVCLCTLPTEDGKEMFRFDLRGVHLHDALTQAGRRVLRRDFLEQTQEVLGMSDLRISGLWGMF
jgi:hypothetical protein